VGGPASPAPVGSFEESKTRQRARELLASGKPGTKSRDCRAACALKLLPWGDCAVFGDDKRAADVAEQLEARLFKIRNDKADERYLTFIRSASSQLKSQEETRQQVLDGDLSPIIDKWESKTVA
jgi:hypothetical protein